MLMGLKNVASLLTTDKNKMVQSVKPISSISETTGKKAAVATD